MRIIRNENNGWLFRKEKDKKETEVCLPHTWNAEDGSSGGIGYDRTRAWYKKSLFIDRAYEGKRIYLEFGAVGTMAEVYINEVRIPYAKYDIYGIGNDVEYMHRGGFSNFRFDVSDYVIFGEDNHVSVMVSNVAVPEIAPIRGDFNIQGGIYRDVKLVVTDAVHVDMMDYGSKGVYITPQKLTPPTDDNKDFKLNVRSNIINESDTEKEIKITAILCEPSSYDVPDNEYIKNHLRFNIEDMYTEGGFVKAELPSETIVLKSGEVFEYNKTIEVTSPKLWDGLYFPYRYELRFSISADGDVADEITEYVGFRYFTMPRPMKDEKGSITGGKFYLNGREYVLRGAGKHQDWGRGKDAFGYAIGEKERLSDAGIMYELGMNSVRLVHYQHSNEEIELYDKLGILVWSEVGIVGNIIQASSSKYQAFLNICKSQITEMVKQQYNNPSVFIWGLGNEISREVDSDMQEKLEWMVVPSGEAFQAELNITVKQLDSTRPTTYAAFSLFNRKVDWDSDTVAMNLYPYWYLDHADFLHGGNVGMGDEVKYYFGVPDKDGNIKPIGVSEYGASAVNGCTAPFESDGTVQHPGMDGYTTTYQAYLHEKVYGEIVNELPFVWCSYIWQMFDSASHKQKGPFVYINNKGIVQFDHITKKDSYYFYKANWNKFEPFAHVVKSDTKDIVKVYSNCDELELYINGERFGEKITDVNVNDAVVDGFGVFRWYNVPDGKINLYGYINGEKVEINRE